MNAYCKSFKYLQEQLYDKDPNANIEICHQYVLFFHQLLVHLQLLTGQKP